MKCPDGCTCGKHKRRSDDTPPDSTDSTETDTPPNPLSRLSLTYRDRSHRYYIKQGEERSRRASGVSTVAKVVADDRNIRLWHERMVALGLTVEPEGRNLRENVAAFSDDKDALEDFCEQAKKIAKAHFAADRGTQKHRVLELILTGQKDKLITDQQRLDAIILERTLDRYRLTPRTELAEQFIIYPEHYIAGRFDAVLMFETADGRVVLVDLKSGENAVKYPHATGAQLAMYTNAPLVSLLKPKAGDVEITEWHSMPANLDHDVAYVLLVDNTEQVGTLHRFDIQHGWKAAQWAIQLVGWRKQLDYGREMVSPVTDRFATAVLDATTEAELRAIWVDAKQAFCLTDALKQAILVRRGEVNGQAQAS